MKLGRLLAGIIVGVAGWVLPVEAQQPTRIIIADAKTTHHLNLYVAQELGIFQKHNLEVEIREVRELSAARDAVVAGQADVFWSCPTVAIAAIANGAPFQVIAQVKKPCTSVLLVRQDSPIRQYTDLKDKRIGGISPTCEAVIALSKKAREAGGEFQLEKLAGGPAIAALEAGRIDGAILEEPHASIAELSGFKVIFRDASENIPCRTINARTAFINQNADALKRLLAAVEEANAIILKDPAAEQIVQIAHKWTGAPEDAIRHGNYRLKFTTRLDEAGLQQLGDELVREGHIREYPARTIFAPQFHGITHGQ